MQPAPKRFRLPTVHLISDERGGNSQNGANFELENSTLEDHTEERPSGFTETLVIPVRVEAARPCLDRWGEMHYSCEHPV